MWSINGKGAVPRRLMRRRSDTDLAPSHFPAFFSDSREVSQVSRGTRVAERVGQRSNQDAWDRLLVIVPEVT